MDTQPLYTITGMQPFTHYNSLGTPVQGYRVDFRTATGHAGFVTVDRSGDVAAEAHAAAEAEARKIIDTINRPVTAQHIPPVS